MVERVKAAFVGFGEINSPKDLIDSKCNEALKAVRSLGMDTIHVDTVTDDANGLDVQRALVELGKHDFDLLFVCLAGWIPSHAVIAITEAYKTKPMILWGLAGDREGGHIVTAAAQAGTTALRKVFADLDYRFRYIYNVIGKPFPLEAIEDFASAVAAGKQLRQSNIGMMGFRDMKLYNTLYDGMSLKSKLGVDVDFFEMLEMLQYCEDVNGEEVDGLLQKIKTDWEFTKPADEDFLRQGVTYYLGLKKIVEEKRFDAISLKDVDGMKKILGFPPAMIFMLLSDELHLCTIPENDTMGAVTQLIIKYLTGQCAAYFEFYEFFENSVLMGVPDYVPAEVVDGRVTVTSAAFGDISGGVLNISKVKTGLITLARLSNTADRYQMHIATGEARFQSWEEAGWDQPAPQLPSMEVILDVDMSDFVQKISGQHYIVSYGDHRNALKDFCYLNGIEVE